MSQSGGQSSSGSAHNTSSSLSSAGTVSSMETIPTQDVADIADGGFDGTLGNPEVKIWGRLFPLGKLFTLVDMDDTKDSYIFGRDSVCDVCYSTKEMGTSHMFGTLSKTHFKIFREVNDGSTFVFIEDLSSNGTFINDEKIGKGKRRVLRNNDQLSLSMVQHKAYVFVDSNSDQEQENLPAEMKQKYILSRLIGRGACGLVKLAFEKETCRKVAVKMIEKKTFSLGGTMMKNMEKSVMEEVKILKALNHPCIIRIEDVYHSDDTLYIVLELVEGGELFDRVAKHGKFTEKTAKLVFYQMLSATKYLHDNKITHRDLKPENVLLCTDEAETLVKVTDFGLSKFVGENSLMQTFCGTPTYLAPEILTSSKLGGYGRACDCWSLGVILFICLSGYPPFSDELKVMSLEDQIKRGFYNFPKQYWNGVSDEAIDLIKKLLTVDPKHRITTSRALQHPWLNDEEVIGKAEKLMNISKNNNISNTTMPPPSIPVLSKKRPRETVNGNDTDSNSSSSSADCNLPLKVSKSLSNECDTTTNVGDS